MKVNLDFEICRYGGVVEVTPFTKRAEELTNYFVELYAEEPEDGFDGTLTVDARFKDNIMFELFDNEMTARLTF